MAASQRRNSTRYGTAPARERNTGAACIVKLSFESALIEVWRQCLVENARNVTLAETQYPVRRTPKRGLREVDFTFDGHQIRGLEQNPDTKSRWAQFGPIWEKSYAVPC